MWVWTECWLVWFWTTTELLHTGVCPSQTDDTSVAAATVNAATLLRVEDEIGQLAAGYYADVVAVRGDPFADVTLLESPEFVMKNGAVVVNRSQ